MANQPKGWDAKSQSFAFILLKGMLVGPPRNRPKNGVIRQLKRLCVAWPISKMKWAFLLGKTPLNTLPSQPKKLPSISGKINNLALHWGK